MKVLLIVDLMNWAWGIKAKALKKSLPQYDIDILTLKQLKTADFNKYNSIHSFSWTDTTLGKYRKNSTCGVSGNSFLFRYNEAKVKIPPFAAIGTTSKKLYEIVKASNLVKDIYNTSNGVDHEFFYPPKNKKLQKKFIVGWVGKKTRGGFIKSPIDYKGYNNVMLPLKNKLKNNKDIEFRVIDNDFKKTISREDMREFYQQLDLFVCTSYREGTPNPAFEASACGIPVLSTDVGCIPEFINNKHNGIMIPSYDDEKDIIKKDIINTLYNKIIFFKNNLDLAIEMGKNNREVIEKDWTWIERSKQWIPLFENYRLR